VDVVSYIKSSVHKGHLLLCLSWVIDYLGMMDVNALQLSYYQRCVQMLTSIYQYVIVPLLSFVQRWLVTGALYCSMTCFHYSWREKIWIADMLIRVAEKVDSPSENCDLAEHNF